MTKKFFCTLKNGHFAPGNQLFKMAIFRALLNYLRALLNFYARKNLKKNSSIVDQSVITDFVKQSVRKAISTLSQAKLWKSLGISCLDEPIVNRTNDKNPHPDRIKRTMCAK